ncbi:thiol reductase thioredoxin [Neptunitalea chrysea]|uniref:Thiol reductase thioredoxin n=1 Tax=Neptunitalea chrysea TaxID=1647581 RepID=A0A9W6B3Q5_9FLAO|nr:thioredoxin family protein [Neptunitalea chrysea]GLB50985.1 thiol reductase thioredoxin [Neptunitalea chrysea]
MSKFGDLIDVTVPVLFDFYAHLGTESTNHPVLLDVATTMGDNAKIIKINVEKNQELIEALKITVVPTYIIYKNGEMVWRQSGNLDASMLALTLQEFV